MPSHKLIEDQAAAWLARRDSGAWSEEDVARLHDWLDAATAHRVAYLRLEAAWEGAQRLRALGAGLPAGAVPPPGEWRHTPFFDREAHPSFVSAAPEPRRKRARGRTRLRYGIAASVLLAVALGAYFYLAPRGDNYSTPIGEVASVPLRDGSNITLNTASTVRVDLTPQERRVDLERGEAFFVVARDPNRPFVVSAGNKRVVAVGTQFSMRREGDELRVIVTEGTVRLEAIGHPLHVEGADDQRGAGSAISEYARLPAGSIARASDGDVLVQEKSITEAEEALTWRAGYLTFRETTLAEAVEEFNRYNTQRIVIEDPTVAATRISGMFRPTNYEAFVRLLHEGYGIHSHPSDGEITLTAQ
jgi:transmembrane sensor